MSDSRGDISLRDYFAAKAMQAYLVSPATAERATLSPSACAEWAYDQASAMLRERSEWGSDDHE